MTIPETYASEVLEDLAALYLSGEAAPGTRAFVEACAAADAGYAARLRHASKLELQAPPVAVHEDAQLVTLRRTREQIRLRTLFLAMGIAFTVLPLTFTFGPKGVDFVFWPGETGVITAFWSVALASWVASWVLHRDVKKRGL
ncbi:MAG: hypothetical protein HY821_03670 [Acidobacteria bacterium]|nr:hypothetical protein [Acidobacteriota bacterium]